MRRIRTFCVLAALMLAANLAGCAAGPTSTVGPSNSPSPVATSTIPNVTEAAPAAAEATGTVDPTEAWTSALATLDSQLTSEPCSADKVLAYSNAVLQLSDEHMQDASLAQRLESIDDPAEIDQMYDRAVSRLDRLHSIVPPNCVSTAHLKFTNAFGLLVDVWDHLGEREYELAQRKLESSFSELAKGAEILTAVQSRLGLER